MATPAQTIREKLQNRLLKEVKILDERLDLGNLSANKNAILMETKRFAQSTLNTKQCCETLVKIFHLLVKGESLTPSERSEIFFNITLLFQSNDRRLRRLVYLVVKSLNVKDVEVFIITSSLTKDLNSGNDCFRANALRVFSKIADNTMASQIERYLKTAVVDRNPFVASSALVCGIHLWKDSHDIVKRWVNEITEAVNSNNPMVQFHSVALLHELKQSDRLALQKFVAMLSKKDTKSVWAECLILRYSIKLITPDTDIEIRKTLLNNLQFSLALSNDMLRLEASKALTSLAIYYNAESVNGTLFGFEILPAVITLRDFLSSSKPVVRFAAMKQLNLLSQHCPWLVMQFSADVELQLSDPNRSIASLALTTLLKIGNEANIDRLIKQLTSFINEGTDSFKLDVLRAVKTLCLTYPSKHRILMNVLSNSLREDGNFDSKNESVNALMTIIDKIPDSLETGIGILCEFIEDCEFPSLCMSILSFLGERIPTTSCPSKFIRFIYNRLILENAHLRAAGVHSLAKISNKCPELRKDILILLESCSTDNDDEVRDRTNLYCKVIQISLEKSPDSIKVPTDDSSTIAPLSLDSFLSSYSDFSIDSFCDQLTEHINNNIEEIFDSSQLLSEEAYKQKISSEHYREDAQSTSILPEVKPGLSHHIPKTLEPEQELFNAISPIAPHDFIYDILISSPWQSLTEREAEYGVAVKKHIFQHFLVLEFRITNTLNDEVLSDVFVHISGFNSNYFEVMGSIPIDNLIFDEPRSSYIILKSLSEYTKNLNVTFDVQLRYRLVDSYSAVSDEYMVDPLVIGISDYINPSPLRTGQFMMHWERYSQPETEKVGQFSLNFRSTKDAVDSLLKSMNMSPCEKSDMVDLNKSKHTLFMSGLFLNKVEILCMGSILMDPQHGYLLKLSCRCQDPLICAAVIDSIE